MNKFSQRHYVAIAAVLAEHNMSPCLSDDAEVAAANRAAAITKDLADLFAADSPNFDRVRFGRAARIIRS